MVNRTLLDFYDMVEKLMVQLDLKDKPAYLWNCDETVSLIP
jgi:hypothetical protein